MGSPVLKVGCWMPRTCRGWPASKNPMLLVLLLSLISPNALGQGSTLPFGDSTRPVVGSTSGISPPEQLPFIRGSSDLAPHQHLRIDGQPCLSVFAGAQRQKADPKIFDHMIFAKNECSQAIKIRVCYYKSPDCIQMEVPPYGRKQATLGIFPAIKEFQYEFREQF